MLKIVENFSTYRLYIIDKFYYILVLSKLTRDKNSSDKNTSNNNILSIEAIVYAYWSDRDI